MKPRHAPPAPIPAHASGSAIVPRAAIVPLAALLALLAGCTAAPPEIRDVHTQLRFVDDRTLERSYEQLAFFVRASDTDGFEDISGLYLAHDEAELHWNFDERSWVEVNADGGRWIGSDGVVAPGYGELPRGTYRVIVTDQAGEQAEETFSLSADPSPSSLADAMPELEVLERSVRLTSPSRHNRIEVRDNRGQLRRGFTHAPGIITAARLRGRPAGSEEGPRTLPNLVDLYVFTPGPEGTLLVSGPYRL
jgi:hypothetical protein